MPTYDPPTVPLLSASLSDTVCPFEFHRPRAVCVVGRTGIIIDSLNTMLPSVAAASFSIRARSYNPPPAESNAEPTGFFFEYLFLCAFFFHYDRSLDCSLRGSTLLFLLLYMVAVYDMHAIRCSMPCLFCFDSFPEPPISYEMMDESGPSSACHACLRALHSKCFFRAGAGDGLERLSPAAVLGVKARLSSPARGGCCSVLEARFCRAPSRLL